MAANLPADDPKFDGDAWKEIVALAARLDGDAASGRVVDGEMGMELARSILSLEDGQRSSQARLRAKVIRQP
jgi:hypothetical protein